MKFVSQKHAHFGLGTLFTLNYGWLGAERMYYRAIRKADQRGWKLIEASVADRRYIDNKCNVRFYRLIPTEV